MKQSRRKFIETGLKIGAMLPLVGSTLLSCGFIYKAWQLKFHDKPGLAMDVFKFSIYHLMILFLVLLVDHYLWV